MQGINCIDYATVLVLDDAVASLTVTGSPTLPGKANRAFITCEDAAVRWRADGTDPEANEGHLLAKDASISFTGANYRTLLEVIRFIADTATHVKLKVTYFD